MTEPLNWVKTRYAEIFHENMRVGLVVAYGLASWWPRVIIFDIAELCARKSRARRMARAMR